MLLRGAKPSMWTLVLRMRLSAMRVMRGIVPALAIFGLFLLTLLRVAALGVSLAKPVGFNPALVAAAPNAGMAFGVELPAENHAERSAVGLQMQPQQPSMRRQRRQRHHRAACGRLS